MGAPYIYDISRLRVNITGREEWTNLARKKDWWRAVVITVLNI